MIIEDLKNLKIKNLKRVEDCIELLRRALKRIDELEAENKRLKNELR